MICPHCNKEVESYASIKADSCINLNLSGGCASGLLGYTYTVANAGAANPPTAIGLGDGILNLTGCANESVLNIHYHML